MSLKFTWFNLMPWPYLPDDFREKNRSVWVDIPNRLYDPVEGHEVYNEYMDQLEYADKLGFDGIGVNEHHQNGYGLMPSPNIIAAGAGAADHARGDLRARQLDRALQPADPRSRRVRHARRASPAGGWSPASRSARHGHELLLRPDPALTREKYAEAHDADHARLGRGRAVRFQRQVQQAALRQLLAEADSEAASADLHPRRRLGRDVRFLHRQQLQLLLLVLHRLPAARSVDGQLLGAGGRARQGRITVPRGVRPDDRRGRHRRRGGALVQRAHSVLLQPLPARIRRLRRRAGLSDRSTRSRRASLARLQRQAQGRATEAHVAGCWWMVAWSSPAAPRPCASGWRS